jgi:CBS domain-containing protein
MKRRWIVRVGELVGRRNGKVITVEPRTDVGTAVRLLFAHNVGGLPVVAADGSVVGFVAERDIVRSLNGQDGLIRHMLVRDVMRPAQFCDADDTIEYAMRLMTSERVRHLVVRDHGRMIGVLSVGDMVKYRLEQFETETAVLRDYVAAHRAAG